MTAPPSGGHALLPGTRRDWIIATGRISGLMLVLLGVGVAGEPMPGPLGRPVVRAWGRVARALRDVPDRPVDAPGLLDDDLPVFGAAARALGHELCRYRVSGATSPAVSALLAEARVHDTPPEQLVALLARVHGVLDAGPGVTADALWRAR